MLRALCRGDCRYFWRLGVAPAAPLRCL